MEAGGPEYHAQLARFYAAKERYDRDLKKYHLAKAKKPLRELALPFKPEILRNPPVAVYLTLSRERAD